MKKTIGRMLKAEAEARGIVAEAEKKVEELKETAQHDARACAQEILQKAQSEAALILQRETESAKEEYDIKVEEACRRAPTRDSIPQKAQSAAVAMIVSEVLSL